MLECVPRKHIPYFEASILHLSVNKVNKDDQYKAWNQSDTPESKKLLKYSKITVPN